MARSLWRPSSPSQDRLLVTNASAQQFPQVGSSGPTRGRGGEKVGTYSDRSRLGQRKLGCKSYSFVPRPGARGTREALGRHSGGSRGHSGGSSPNAPRVPPECPPTAPRALLEGLTERPESPPSAPRVPHSTLLKCLFARAGCLRLTVARLRPCVTGAMTTRESASAAGTDSYGWYWTRACASSLMCCGGVWVCVRVPGRSGKYVRTYVLHRLRAVHTHVMAYVRT